MMLHKHEQLTCFCNKLIPVVGASLTLQSLHEVLPAVTSDKPEEGQGSSKDYQQDLNNNTADKHLVKSLLSFWDTGAELLVTNVFWSSRTSSYMGN